LLLDWLAYLPFFNVVFRQKPSAPFARTDRIFGFVLGLIWVISCIALMWGGPIMRLIGLGLLFAIFRHYYINQRWTNIRRGCGAPGFMAYWIVFYLFILEGCCWLDASGVVPGAVLALMKYDFALIMLCAGAYKMCSGYLREGGMEYGQANPFWGYFWTFFRHQNTRAPFFRVMNGLACGIEVVAGVLMLTPNLWVQFAGAAMVSLSFIYVGCLIRLGRLAFLMAVIPLIFWPAMGLSLVQTTHPLSSPLLLPWMIDGCVALIFVIMLTMGVIKFMQYVNLFANRKFPSFLQNSLTRLANLWPVIIWRVFTVDVTNFFIRLYSVSGKGEVTPLVHETTTFNYRNGSRLWLKLRFLHVTESIALASVFTTLKYFPSKPELFRDKLVRYAHSVVPSMPYSPAALRFEYVSLQKTESGFAFIPVGSHTVDLQTDVITEDKYLPEFDYARPAAHSPVRESAEVGAYTPRSS